MAEFDMTALNSAMKTYGEVARKSTAVVIKQTAKSFTKYIIAATPPNSKKSQGKKAKKTAEMAIMKDLLQIFKPLKPKQIAEVESLQGKSSSQSFGHKGAAALGNIQIRILSFDEMDAWHHDRRGKNGRVFSVNRDATTGLRVRDLVALDIGLCTEADFTAYLKSRYALVGLLAGGWNASAEALKVARPAWVKRHGSRRGSYTLAASPDETTITLGNAVGFVDNVRAYDRRMAFALKASTGNLERQTAAILAKAAKLANLTPA